MACGHLGGNNFLHILLDASLPPHAQAKPCTHPSCKLTHKQTRVLTHGCTTYYILSITQITPNVYRSEHHAPSETTPSADATVSRYDRSADFVRCATKKVIIIGQVDAAVAKRKIRLCQGCYAQDKVTEDQLAIKMIAVLLSSTLQPIKRAAEQLSHRSNSH